jgi:hypothetical protein
MFILQTNMKLLRTSADWVVRWRAEVGLDSIQPEGNGDSGFTYCAPMTMNAGCSFLAAPVSSDMAWPEQDWHGQAHSYLQSQRIAAIGRDPDELHEAALFILRFTNVAMNSIPATVYPSAGGRKDVALNRASSSKRGADQPSQSPLELIGEMLRITDDDLAEMHRIDIYLNGSHAHSAPDSNSFRRRTWLPDTTLADVGQNSSSAEIGNVKRASTPDLPVHGLSTDSIDILELGTDYILGQIG